MLAVLIVIYFGILEILCFSDSVLHLGNGEWFYSSCLCNPMHAYSDVSLVEFNEIYIQVGRYRIAVWVSFMEFCWEKDKGTSTSPTRSIIHINFLKKHFNFKCISLQISRHQYNSTWKGTFNTCSYYCKNHWCLCVPGACIFLCSFLKPWMPLSNFLKGSYYCHVLIRCSEETVIPDVLQTCHSFAR